MKQGTGNHRDAGGKVEPTPHAVGVKAVAEMGVHQMRLKSQPIPSLHAGRGFKAPGIETSIHHCGSQGKHR